MSAIIGIYRLDGKPVSDETLRPVMSLVAHYGSDGSGMWSSGSAGLGCQMLRLTPESVGERQPYTEGHLTIVADVRIDNRRELFDALNVPHSERGSMPDSALLLRGYEKWNADLPKHLVGDFAFAIRDERTRSMFCARDHIGAKPFYYCHTPSIFAFASDIRAVLAFEGIKPTIDESEIARMMLHPHHTYYDPKHTYFENIYKLPFAHSMVISEKGLSTTRYWRPEEIQELKPARIDDYADELMELVDGAVEAALRSRLPVGSHLSGGLDSSSIAILASRQLKSRGLPPLAVFSWSPPPDEDYLQTEHRRIMAICQQEGMRPTFLERDRQSELKGYQIDISTKPAVTVRSESMIQEDAQRQGVRLMLSGWGGDETVSFNARGLASEYLLRGNWRRLANYSRLDYAVTHPARLPGAALRVWEKAIVPTLPDIAYRRLSKRGKNLLRRSASGYIKPEFVAQVRGKMRPVGRPLRESASVRSNQLHLYHNGHMTARMESWAAFGADHGITYAFPLTNRRVMEFAYGLPGWVYYQQTFARYLFRYTMARIFPHNATWDSVKVDTTLNDRVLRKRPDSEIRERNEWLEANRFASPNPWVDVPKLRAQLLEGVRNPRRPNGAEVQKAMSSLTVWHNWLAEKRE